MKLLRIKDNSQQKKDVFSQVAKLTGKIADETLEQLEREGVFVFPETVKDAEDITQDQMILQSVNDTYRSGNVMGFLGYGDERLVIESRFCGEGEDYFFQYLLDKVLDFPNIVDLDADANQDNRLFNFLLFLFPYYLKVAMRKGLFKKYIRHRYNDGNVKGTIDVARHIEKNIPFVGNVAYSQREFSYDNSLMELVRHTVEFIKRKPYGNKLLIKVKDEVKLVIDTHSLKESKIDYPKEFFAEKDMIELYPLQLQPGDDAASWIFYTNALRDLPIQYNQSTVLPLPLHLAKGLEEYLFKV